jgi:hypothetical protein
VLYAPNIFEDEMGRLLMWGWLQERRMVSSREKEGGALELSGAGIKGCQLCQVIRRAVNARLRIFRSELPGFGRRACPVVKIA